MNILIVTPFDIHATGGVSTSVKMLCREFVARGHRTTVLTPGDDSFPRLIEHYAGAPVFRIYLRIPYVPDAPVLGMLAFIAYFPITLYSLCRFLQSQQTEIVSVQYPSTWNAYFGLLRPWSRWKLFVTFLGNDAHDLPSAAWPDRAALRLLLRCADHVTAVSGSLIRSLRTLLPDAGSRSSVIHTGAPEVESGDSSRPTGPLPCADYMLAVGQLIDRKGIDLLVEALALMVANGADARLVVAGEGPARSKLEQLIAERGLGERVFLIGDQSHDEVLGLLRSASFFVLGSRAEGLPLVILEAMICGAAVVATDVDGVGEVVEDGVTGLLVKPESPEALADAMLRLHRDPSLRRTLSEAASARVRRDFTLARDRNQIPRPVRSSRNSRKI